MKKIKEVAVVLNLNQLSKELKKPYGTVNNRFISGDIKPDVMDTNGRPFFDSSRLSELSQIINSKPTGATA
jgi:hypothetical protein